MDADGNNIPIVSNSYENGKGVIKLEKDCYQIGNNTFCDCTGLTNISIPKTITSIMNYAFSGCTLLVEITIPEAVTTIGSYVFSGCTSLTEITIPEAISIIGSSAFKHCSKLSKITFLSTKPEIITLGSGIFSGIASDAIAYVPSGLENKYKRKFSSELYINDFLPIS